MSVPAQEWADWKADEDDAILAGDVDHITVASGKAKAKKIYKMQHPVRLRAAKELDRAKKRVAQRVETAGGRAAERAARTVLTPRRSGGGGGAAAAGGAATTAGAVPLAAQAAAVLAAAAVGWFLGDAVREASSGRTRELREQAVNQAYRSAVRRLRAELGRDPTPDEIKPLAAAWRDAIARIKANEPVSRASRSW